jgi:hypothetical protein
MSEERNGEGKLEIRSEMKENWKIKKRNSTASKELKEKR